MYSFEERDNFFNKIMKKIELSNNIIGTYLIGSSSIGFNDIYSDLDFMIAYKEDIETQLIRNEILEFFKEDDVGYIMERKWTDRTLGISVYLKNGLSIDISYGPLKELKIKSKQIKVGVDTNKLLEEHLKSGIKIFEDKYSNYNIDQNIIWEFMYIIRKYLISIKRKNYIYAYSLLNDARMIIMNLEGLNEGKKMHEFKAYNELEKEFIEEILKTIPSNIQLEELEKCKDNILELFYKTINNSDKIKFDENSKYLLEIAD